MANNAEFGSLVKQAMAGKNYRTEAERMGIHFTVLYDMAKGLVKSRKTIEKFASAMGVDAEELLIAAGKIEEQDASTLVDRLIDRAEEAPEEFTYVPELESFTLEGFPGAENLQPKSREIAERAMRQVIAEVQRRQGRE